MFLAKIPLLIINIQIYICIIPSIIAKLISMILRHTIIIASYTDKNIRELDNNIIYFTNSV